MSCVIVMLHPVFTDDIMRFTRLILAHTIPQHEMDTESFPLTTITSCHTLCVGEEECREMIDKLAISQQNVNYYDLQLNGLQRSSTSHGVLLLFVDEDAYAHKKKWTKHKRSIRKSPSIEAEARKQPDDSPSAPAYLHFYYFERSCIVHHSDDGCSFPYVVQVFQLQSSAGFVLYSCTGS